MPVTRTSTPAVQFSLVSNAAITLNSTQSYNLQLALSGATNRISTFLARTDRSAALTSLFGSAGTAATTFNTNVSNLLTVMSGTGLGLQVELRSAADMNGAAVAYAPSSPTGGPRIYLNVDLLSNGTSSDLISWLLLEAAGHNIDSRLNGLLDTAGDEGKAFAALLTGRTLTDSEMATYGRDPAGGVVMVNGVPVAVECEANKGPSASATALNGSFSEAAGLASQAAAVAVFSNANVSVGGANETWQTITALRFTVAGLRDGSAETVNFDGTSISLGAASSGTTAGAVSGSGFSYSVAIANSVATINLSRSNGVSAAAVNALLNGLTYQNTNRDDPSAGTRTITLTSLTDSGGAVGGGTGVSSPNLSGNITVVAVNDGPAVTVTSTNNTFSEAQGLATQAAAVAVFTGASVSTIEAGQSILGLGFSVSGLRDGNAEILTIDGTTIALGANRIGVTTGNGLSYGVVLSNGTATINLSSATGLSASAANALLNGLSYQNTNRDNPSAGARTISLTSLRDSGGTANGGSDTITPNLTSTITLLAVNDAPLLGSLAGVNLVDTAAFDAFSPTSGSLSASDPEGSALSYGLNGASPVATSFDGLNYDLAASGSYGTLYLNSSSGQYRFQPKSDWSLNALSASGSDSFQLSVSDGSLTTSTPLVVNFSGAYEAPEQYVVATDSPVSLNATGEAIWEQALANASRYLADLLTRSDRDQILADVFGNAGTDPITFAYNEQALLNLIGGTGMQITLDLRTDSEMNGANGAYAAIGHTGSECIYINGDQINSGALSVDALTAVLLHEYGHAIDPRLNGNSDSPGEEGQLFASEVIGTALTADQLAAIQAASSSAMLTIGGVQVSVEEAATALASSTLGTTTTTTTYTQLIRPSVISVQVTITNPSTNGQDVLIAAFSGTTLIGWTIYNNTGDLATGAGANTFSFDLSQFSATSFSGLTLRAWQGTTQAGVSNGTYSTSSTASFAASTTTAPTSANFSVSTTTGNGISATWANISSGLTYTGTSGNDTITGGAGSDIFVGSGGIDQFTGGGGNNNYAFKPGDTNLTIDTAVPTPQTAIITDFTGASDKIRVTSPGVAASIATAVADKDAFNGTIVVKSSTDKKTGVTTDYFLDKYAIASTGRITFTDTSASNVNPDDFTKLSAILEFLSINDIGDVGSTVFFLSGGDKTFNGLAAASGGTKAYDTFVYSQSIATPSSATPDKNAVLIDIYDSDGTAFTSITTSTGSATAISLTNGLYPGISSPSSVNATEDTTLNLTGSNLISFTDNETNLYSVTLSVNKGGTLNIQTLGSATVASGLNNSSSITLRGSQADLNSAVATLAYKGASDFNGSETLTIQATDSTNLSVSSTVTLNVAAVNDAPVANADSLSVDEGSVVTGTILNNDTDAESNTLSVFSVNGTAYASLTTSSDATYTSALGYRSVALTNGTLYIKSNGTVAYRHNGSETTSDSFSYVTTDSQSANPTSSSATVSITVAPVNDAPVANADSLSVDEGSVVTGTILNNDTDAESNTLSVFSVNGTAYASLTTSSDATYTSALGYRSVALTNGTLYIKSNGTVAYRHNGSETTSDSFSYVTTDSQSANPTSSSATVSITVAPVNDAPVANADSLSVDEGSVVTGTILNNDTDAESNTLSVFSVNGTAYASLTTSSDATYTSALGYRSVALTNGTLYIKSNGTVAYRHNGSETTSDSFSYVTTDSQSANPTSSSATVSITVAPVNDAPVANADSLSVDEGSVVTGTILNNDTDAESNTLSVFSVNGTAYASLTTSSDATYTSALGYRSVALTNGTLYIKSNGTVAYRHNGSETTSDSFSYVTTDSQSANPTSSSATVSITVAPVNDAPVANADSLSVDEGSVVTGTILNNDTDAESNTLSVFSVNGTAYASLTTSSDATYTSALGYRSVALTNGTLYIKSNGTVAYRHNGSETTSDSFSYVTTDSQSANPTSSSATVSITVAPVNDAPVANADSLSVDEGSVVTGTILNNDTDAESNTLSVFSVNGTAYASLTTSSDATYTSALGYRSVALTNGTLYIKSNGTVAYRHNGSETTSDSFSYVTTDSQSANPTSSSATVSITVAPVNDAPAGANNTVTVLEDSAYTLAASDFGFTDPNDSPANTLAAVKISSLPLSGELRFNGTAITSAQVTAGYEVSAADLALNKLTFVPAGNANGSSYASFNFQVRDNGGTTNSGVDLDQTANTITIDVTSVNDAPAGTDKTVTVLEDGTYAFAASAFGFSDSNDSPANSLAAVKISSLPVAGELRFNGTAITSAQVTAGYEVSAADLALNKLTFVPASNANGSSYASFTFQVRDNGGTTNSGVDLDQSANTITINVTSVNDAPVATAKTITTLEDTGYTFAASDFGFTDTESNTLQAVIISALPAAGSLTLNGTAVTLNQSIAAASIGDLVYTPAANANGNSYTSFGFKVQDNGGTSNGGVDTSAQVLITVNVTPVNDAPVATAKTITTLEDTGYTFAASDFGFTDTESNSLQAVIISALPAAGSLTLNGTAVTLNQSIAAASIGDLVYTPAANANGNSYTSFGFKVQDNGGTSNGGVDTSAQVLITVNVTPVNDAPVATAKTITTLEDTGYTFAASDFGFTDTESNSLQAVIISALPAAGSLTLNGTAVTLNQSIAAASIGDLVYTPAANANGNSYTSFGFKVQDNGGTSNGGVDTSAQVLITVNVTPVNDAPVATAKTITTLEDTGYTFAASDFGFTDTESNTLQAVIISALPAAGTLTLSGTAVTLNQSIAAASIGNLVYTPAANANGNSYTTFGFKVQDNGGTSNGGVDTSAQVLITVNVTPVNDAPVATAKTITTLEDTGYTFAASDFGFTDTESNTLQAVIISALPAAGTLTLSGTAVTLNQSIAAASIGNLVYTPAANANGNSYTTFGFKVQDNGGTSNGGVDTSAQVLITVNVTPVNDAPVATAKTITTLEDTGYTFAASDFGFTDTESNTLQAVIISALPAAGSLTFNGTAVALNQSIAAASIGDLVYTPAANANGNSYTSFGFKVQDNGGTSNGGVDTSAQVLITVNVTPVNDAPVATAKTIITLEDTGYTFAASDFGFTDTESNTLQAVIISALPAAGTLTLSGTAVTLNQSIAAASIGDLVYTPAANANGNSYTSFGFKVQDNGGTSNGGVDTSAQVLITVNVTPVNDAPVATAKTITTLEDTGYTFAASDFGFTDTESNTLQAVIISALPAAGSLTFNGTAVALNQSIAAASIGDLVYTPAANANGNSYTSFGFKVQDNGGTSNGGVDTSAQVLITVNVTPVNDAPVATAKTIITLEDTGYTFAASDFGFTDTESNTLQAVIISALPAAGSLTFNGTAVALNQSIAAASIGDLVYTPAANANGNSYTSFGFKVQDNGGTSNGGVDTSAQVLITVNVTPVNDAPVATAKTIITLEDTGYTFAASDFGFTDTESNTLQAVIISALPAAGSLTFNGTAVTLNQSIAAASIGDLVYTPAANANGNSYTSFGFKVQDNGGTSNGGVDTSAQVLITVNVTPVNDAPVATAKTITTLEDTGYTFAASDFGFTDTESNTLQAVIISDLPAAGSLTLNGTAVTLNQSIAAASIGDLVYTPAANANGNSYTSFGFKVQDNGGTSNGGVDTSAQVLITVNVTPVNDAPVATAKTITTLEDTGYTFAASDFGFTDTESNTLQAVIISDLPAAGSLTLNGTAVTLNQSIAAASIGDLVYTPAANANGNSYTSFGFKVQDNGGISNGGVDTSAQVLITVNVTPVNDAPTFTQLTAPVTSGNDNTPIGISLNDLVAKSNAADIDGSVTAFVVQAVSAGTLLIGATAQTATPWNADSNATIDANHNAYWTSAVNAYGNIQAFTVIAKDNGGLTSSTAIPVLVAVSDKTPPTASVAISAISTDTGSSPSDFITSDTSLTISGSNGALGSGEKVQISIDGITWTDVNQSSATNWTYTDPTERSGNVTYQVRAMDAFNNVGNTASQLVVVDTIAPGIPSITTVIDNVNPLRGSIVSGSSTNDSSPTIRINLAGTNAAVGDQIQLMDGDTSLGTVGTITASILATGSIDVRPPVLIGGQHAIKVRLVDAAGNSGELSSAFNFTVDVTAPDSLTLSLNDTGVSGDGITNNAVFTIGNLEQGNSWQYALNGGTTWFTGSGTSFTVNSSTTATGVIRVRQADGAGNTSAATSYANLVTIDKTAPTVAITASSQDLKLYQTSLITFTFSEVPYGFSSTDVTVNGGTLSEPTVSSDPKVYTATFTPATNLYGTATIRIADAAFTDAAGNANADGSDANNSLSIAVDTIAPGNEPTVSLSTASPIINGNQSAVINLRFSEAVDGFTMEDLIVSGSAGTLSNLQGSGTLWTVLFTPSATNANGQVTIHINSGAFASSSSDHPNVDGGDPDNSLTITVDSTAPAATVTGLSFSNDSGRGDVGDATYSDLRTNTALQTINGTLSAALNSDETVQISIDGGTSWRNAITTGQAFSLAGVVLSSGGNLLARVIDQAGNLGSTYNCGAYLLDTSTFTGVLSLTGFSGTLSYGIASGGLTDNSFTLSLPSPESGTSITYQRSVDAGATWSNLSSTSESGLAAGTYLYRASVIDLAGNRATSNVLTVVIDGTPPEAPQITLASDLLGLSTINASQLGRSTGALVVSAESGSRVVVQITSGSTTISKTLTGSGGSQGVILSSAEVASLANGSISVSATATDAAGNASAAGSFSFAYQAVEPTGTLSVRGTQSGNETGPTGPIDSQFTISRTGPTTNPITVRYSLGGNAIEGDGLDYRFSDANQATLGYGEVTIAAGQSSATVSLPTVNNSVANNSRNIIFNFVRPGDYNLNYLVDSTYGSASVSLIDNDTAPAPQITVSDLTVVEGNSGSKLAYITVSLDNACATAVSVNYAFSDGTGTSGSDYTATNGTLTFEPNTRSKTIAVTINGDTTKEADETFLIQLSSPSANATLGASSSATVTITNDDQDSAITTDPNAGVTITASGTFSGGDKNDVLTGGSGNDNISGLGGNDIIEGKGGRDALSGGTGDDLFIYTTLSDSTLTAYDNITDFRPDNSGDRLVVSSLPGKLWNAGRITSTTLAGAASLAFGDCDIITNGSQQLGGNEAVLFTWGTRVSNQRLYVAINDSVAGLTTGENPFCVELGTLQQYITQTGQLDVNLIFKSADTLTA